MSLLTSALRDEIRRQRDARTRVLVADELPDDPWHGTTSGYDTRKCRCERCRNAAAAARRTRRSENREASNAYNRAYKARRRAQAREARTTWSASA